MWPTHCEGLMPWPVPGLPCKPLRSLQAAYDLKGHPPSCCCIWKDLHRLHALKATCTHQYSDSHCSSVPPIINFLLPTCTLEGGLLFAKQQRTSSSLVNQRTSQWARLYLLQMSLIPSQCVLPWVLSDITLPYMPYYSFIIAIDYLHPRPQHVTYYVVSIFWLDPDYYISQV